MIFTKKQKKRKRKEEEDNLINNLILRCTPFVSLRAINIICTPFVINIAVEILFHMGSNLFPNR